MKRKRKSLPILISTSLDHCKPLLGKDQREINKKLRNFW